MLSDGVVQDVARGWSGVCGYDVPVYVTLMLTLQQLVRGGNALCLHAGRVGSFQEILDNPDPRGLT